MCGVVCGIRGEHSSVVGVVCCACVTEYEVVNSLRGVWVVSEVSHASPFSSSSSSSLLSSATSIIGDDDGDGDGDDDEDDDDDDDDDRMTTMRMQIAIMMTPMVMITSMTDEAPSGASGGRATMD